MMKKIKVGPSIKTLCKIVCNNSTYISLNKFRDMASSSYKKGSGIWSFSGASVCLDKTEFLNYKEGKENGIEEASIHPYHDVKYHSVMTVIKTMPSQYIL